MSRKDRMRLDCYSPGNSPLVFEWFHNNQVVSNKPIHPYMIARYLSRQRNQHFKDYEIHKIDGRWTILKKVERVNENTLRMEGKEYTYQIHRPYPKLDLSISDVTFEFEFEFEALQKRYTLQNWSMRLSLIFFLRYEAIWEKTKWEPGKRIKNSDSWVPKA